ncbi:uncharacterized protein FIBRA_06937 [Fibroporia radiculosa]|uniref:DUF6533 domain-containing protein n=1 Tax=Fibroporia radiculosa TaxID=599839 RepID=J4HZW0_9APHY|nr:uncharacterized protein FIBRA_06937 [Fibroporia radiculosa]CCM04747.1 predicted protein [Fibroporia radiculosa]
MPDVDRDRQVGFELTFKFALSAVTFLAYDTLLNIGDEIDYVWRGPRSWVTWAYAFIRHVPSIIAFTFFEWRPEQCRAWIAYQLSFNEALTIAVEGVLIVRIYALYNRNRLVIAAVLFLYMSEITLMIVVIAVSIPGMRFDEQCVITDTPGIFTSYWIISLAFETILFALTLVKFFTSMSRYLGRHSLLFALVRDGTWAYAMTFVIMLMNTLVYHLVKGTLAGVCFCWELAIMSFAGAHVLLNLRRLAADRSVIELPLSVGVDDTIQFTSHIDHAGEGTATGITNESEVTMEMRNLKGCSLSCRA